MLEWTCTFALDYDYLGVYPWHTLTTVAAL